LALLGSSGAEEVIFSATESEVVFKLGRTRAKYSTLLDSDFLFAEPDRKGVAIPIDTAFREALVTAEKSAEEGDGKRTGITLGFGKKKLDVYATDNVTVFHSVLASKAPDMVGKAVILSERFYKLLGKLEDAKLIFTESGDVIGVGKDLELFGKVKDGANPKQFDNVFNSAGLDEIPKADIPISLGRCLDRALVVSKELTEFSYSGGRLSMLTVEQGCEVRDSLKIDLGSDPVEVCTCSEYILRYLNKAKRIGIGNKCIVLEGNSFQVLIGIKAKVKN
jgi:hypothetical protein